MRNATKFTFKGFIQLRLRCAKVVIVQKEVPVGFQDAVQFEVYDTGIGISEANMECLFKLFGKVLQRDKSVNKEGIGLGLYITKQLAIQMGGTITVNSKEGRFTRFIVTVPVKQTYIQVKPDDDLY